MSRTQSTNSRGIAPLLIVLVIVGVLAVAAGGWFAATKLGKGKATVKEQAAQAGEEAAAAPKTVDDLKIDDLEMNLQTSSLPPLDASAVNTPSQNISSGASAFPNLNLDTSIDYDIDLDYEMPTVSDDDIKPKTLAQPSGGSAGGTGAGDAGTGGSQGGTTPTASSCAQFSGIPSCSYVTDSNGRSLCEACKAAGF